MSSFVLAYIFNTFQSPFKTYEKLIIYNIIELIVVIITYKKFSSVKNIYVLRKCFHQFISLYFALYYEKTISS
jgi:hypothetical protein